LAAEQGVADAQYLVALMYSLGRGVLQDDVQAHMWFNLAASRSGGQLRESAVELRDLFASRMTPDQIAEAERLAREWDAAHPREAHCTSC
jgi:TPR repeat protein